MSDRIPATNFSLSSRTGLPDELRGQLQRFPREAWPDRSELGEWSRFWLERHDIFRHLSDALRNASQQMLDRTVDTQLFQQWALARLNMYVGHLDLHHQIEEFHIFPAFAAIEPSLQRGYDLLEADHRTIHPRLPVLHETGQRLARLDPGDTEAALRAAAALLDKLDALAPELARHLADEEDLLIPLVLRYGESALHLH